VVSFTPWPLFTVERDPGTNFIGGWVGPRTCLDDVEKRKFLTLLELEHRPLGRPAPSQPLYRLSYPGSQEQDGGTVKSSLIAEVRFLENGALRKSTTEKANTLWVSEHSLPLKSTVPNLNVVWFGINVASIFRVTCFPNYTEIQPRSSRPYFSHSQSPL
jgi:hypothetical protein